jgi:hypothetical protein
MPTHAGGEWPEGPSMDLCCRRCHVTVERCTKCEASFVEGGLVRCRAEAGHFHDACVERQPAARTLPRLAPAY